MARIKLALALSFVILLLLSPSPESSATARGSTEPADKTISREAREINVHVKKGGGGGGGGRGGGGGGGGRGGGYVGGGMIYPVHVGGHKTSNGTRRSSAVGPRPSLLATAAACSSLCLGLLSASTLV
ncbi:hypothetical protein NL676_034377 [Syzygium grande]|nr:hypothetical protein NL676_034377 [Syzygium grande]